MKSIDVLLLFLPCSKNTEFVSEKLIKVLFDRLQSNMEWNNRQDNIKPFLTSENTVPALIVEHCRSVVREINNKEDNPILRCLALLWISK